MGLTKNSFLKIIPVTPNMGISSGTHHDGTALPVDSTTVITRCYHDRVEDTSLVSVYHDGQMINSHAYPDTPISTDAKFYYTVQSVMTTVNTGSFSIGDWYQIKTVGTTDFTLIGAASNTVGVAFIATGIGSGTGGVAYDLTPATYADSLEIAIKPNPNYRGIGYISGASTSVFLTSDTFTISYYYDKYVVV